MVVIAKLISADVQNNNKLYRNAQTFCERLPRAALRNLSEGRCPALTRSAAGRAGSETLRLTHCFHRGPAELPSLPSISSRTKLSRNDLRQ